MQCHLCDTNYKAVYMTQNKAVLKKNSLSLANMELLLIHYASGSQSISETRTTLLK